MNFLLAQLVSKRKREGCVMPFNQTGNENLGKAINFLKEFDAENLDEKICEIKALQICCSLGFAVCKHCNHHQILKGELQRMYLCNVCRKEIWITGGTFFDHVRKFRPYLASFYLLERGIILSAPVFWQCCVFRPTWHHSSIRK